MVLPCPHFRGYTYLYINRLYISLHINIYTFNIQGAQFIYYFIYIMKYTFFHCAMKIYITFTLFKSNQI